MIKNFIDPEAEFVFLRRHTDWTEIHDGTVFDVPTCELGHHGEDVSFNSILKKYKLTDPALVLLGEIVRAADSRANNPHPAGEGFRWIAAGFGALGLPIMKFSTENSLFTMRFMQSANYERRQHRQPRVVKECGLIFRLLLLPKSKIDQKSFGNSRANKASFPNRL